MAESHPIPTHPLFKDLTGQKFGRLTVVSYAGRRGKYGVHSWNCSCQCGGERTTMGLSLGSGKTVSCGCIQRERAKECATVHGMIDRPEYVVWQGMIARCTYPKNKFYKKYGGAGVRVCDRWRRLFADFIKDMGPRTSATHSLDRHPNRNGNYEPGNVRWATPEEQAHNKDINVNFTVGNETKTISEWSRILNIPRITLRRRIRRRCTEAEFVAKAPGRGRWGKGRPGTRTRVSAATP